MLSELQTKLLDMLTWFDNFCRENDLIYYAIGGTLLGAVRHNGFIPWDDDIDIGMPREDYERFQKLMGTNPSDEYCLETPHSKDEKFCYPYCKLYDMRTTLVENVKSKLRRGIYIDVFPIDGLGNDYETGVKWYKHIKRSNDLYLAKVCGFRKGRSLIKNMATVAMGFVPQFVYSGEKQRVKLDKMCQKYRFSESVYAGNLLGNWGIREIVKKEYFGNPIRIRFENIEVLCVEDYDSYLTAIYGDWKKLPSKEKQVSHHDYIFSDLNQSYIKENNI